MPHPTSDPPTTEPAPTIAGLLRAQLPWVLVALLVVLGVIAYLALTAPEYNPLPEVYSVL